MYLQSMYSFKNICDCSSHVFCSHFQKGDSLYSLPSTHSLAISERCIKVKHIRYMLGRSTEANKGFFSKWENVKVANSNAKPKYLK